MGAKQSARRACRLTEYEATQWHAGEGYGAGRFTEAVPWVKRQSN
jgi:hypothetical protein